MIDILRYHSVNEVKIRIPIALEHTSWRVMESLFIFHFNRKDYKILNLGNLKLKKKEKRMKNKTN